ncbi:MAG: ECF transporter S component [Ruminococcaceae bacterium]|nr:ECF transporter S component [Oscillospiraceae bacterium]
MQTKSRKTLTFIARIALLAATAAILMIFEFPLPFIAPTFYELDFSELPVLIGAFSMGPLAGVLIELIKVLLNLLINGTDTAFVGELANFIMGCAFVVPAGIIYKFYKTKSGALVAMLSGTIFMAISAYFLNAYLLIPTYSKFLPIEQIISMGKEILPVVSTVEKLALYCVVPFNFVKGVLISAITFVLYKHIHRLLDKIS